MKFQLHVLVKTRYRELVKTKQNNSAVKVCVDGADKKDGKKE